MKGTILHKITLAALIMLANISSALADTTVETDAPSTVEVKVGSAGMATYTPTYGLDFSNAKSIAAYKAVKTDGITCYEKVTTVARGEGILLKSINGGSATDTITVDGRVKPAEDNLFVGVLKDTTITEGYVLNNKNGVVAFYEVSGSLLVRAGKCYLSAEAQLSPATVEVKVGSAGMATYTPTYGLDFSNAKSIAAYKAVKTDGITCYEKVSTVARGEGILLKSINGGSATDTISVDDKIKPAEDNLFVGVLKDTTITEGYVLNNKNGVVAFYEVSGSLLVRAGKCYLSAEAQLRSDNSAKLLGLFTGVSEIKANKETDNVYYNINGQRILHPTKGLYIVNGKKRIIK